MFFDIVEYVATVERLHRESQANTSEPSIELPFSRRVWDFNWIIISEKFWKIVNKYIFATGSGWYESDDV